MTFCYYYIILQGINGTFLNFIEEDMSDFMQYLQGNQDRAAERAQEQYLSSLGRKIIAEVRSPATARLFSILEQKRSQWLTDRNYTEYKLR
ncbi:MAG TPA: hypothetical protein PLJ58_02565, partial [bacterium]|nr:hypothetical protein [bacterium]